NRLHDALKFGLDMFPKPLDGPEFGVEFGGIAAVMAGSRAAGGPMRAEGRSSIWLPPLLGQDFVRPQRREVSDLLLRIAQGAQPALHVLRQHERHRGAPRRAVLVQGVWPKVR